MVEECKRSDPHGRGREQVRADEVGEQSGEKRWRIDLEGRGRNLGAEWGPCKIKKCLDFLNSGIKKCEVARFWDYRSLSGKEESEDETKIASSNGGPARRGTTRESEGQMRQRYEADI